MSCFGRGVSLFGRFQHAEEDVGWHVRVDAPGEEAGRRRSEVDRRRHEQAADEAGLPHPGGAAAGKASYRHTVEREEGSSAARPSRICCLA